MKSIICIIMAVLLTNVHVAFAETTASKMIPTVNIVEEMSRAEGVRNITEIISRDDVQAELHKIGLTKDEIKKRLATLSDSEIRELTKQMDQARYGGDAITGILVLVILVLLVIFLAKRV